MAYNSDKILVTVATTQNFAPSSLDKYIYKTKHEIRKNYTVATDTVVSSLRQVIKPGYGLAPRSHTFSSATTAGSTHVGVPVSYRPKYVLCLCDFLLLLFYIVHSAKVFS